MFFANIFSYRQRKRICALAFAKTRQNLARARGRRSRRCSRATASPCATTGLRDPHRHVADASRDPRPLARRPAARADAFAPRRATSTRRSTAGATCSSALSSLASYPRHLLRTSPSPDMAERKRPRRTRERILETSLALFNRHGEPHITTAHIADEMNISPGNLYYHFRNKDDIIGELYAALRGAACCRCSRVPTTRTPDVEDLWFLLHLLFERMWEYRFLYRDLDRAHVAQPQARAALRRPHAALETTVIELCRGMVRRGTHARQRARDRRARAQRRDRRDLLDVVPAHDESADRRCRARRSGDAMRLDRAAYQVLALFAPFTVGDARALIERLGEHYLQLRGSARWRRSGRSFRTPTRRTSYDAAALKKHWARLHRGDCEPLPKDAGRARRVARVPRRRLRAGRRSRACGRRRGVNAAVKAQVVYAPLSRDVGQGEDRAVRGGRRLGRRAPREARRRTPTRTTSTRSRWAATARASRWRRRSRRASAARSRTRC